MSHRIPVPSLSIRPVSELQVLGAPWVPNAQHASSDPSLLSSRRPSGVSNASIRPMKSDDALVRFGTSPPISRLKRMRVRQDLNEWRAGAPEAEAPRRRSVRIWGWVKRVLGGTRGGVSRRLV